MNAQPRWLVDGVLPNLARMTAMWERGALPILFVDVPFAVDEQSVLSPGQLGWSGAAVQLVRANRQTVERLACAMPWARDDGAIYAKWLRSGKPMRLLLLCNADMLFLDFDPESGFAPACTTRAA